MTAAPSPDVLRCTVLLATDAIGERIIAGMRQIRPGLKETDLRRAGSALLATSRPRSAAVAEVVRECAGDRVPLLIVSLDATEVRVGPVYAPEGECFRCHCIADELDRFYDEHQVAAPDGHLPQHVGLAARVALSMLGEVTSAHLTSSASARRTKVIRLTDNSLDTIPGPSEPCPHGASDLSRAAVSHASDRNG